MSVLSYLQKRASEAVLSPSEDDSIKTSISTLQNRLFSHFGATIKHFQFGSSTRGTILPRYMDEQSDIDYMIVFSDSGYTPQTYLDRIRKFVEKYYASSSIKQSSPTIVLELNHIKFDLVPALDSGYFGYQIPSGTSSWQNTNPNEFNAALTAKNNAELWTIKPTIRLAKLWNANVGYVYESYSFEQFIVNQFFYDCANQKDYLFRVFENLGLPSVTWQKDKVQRAKDIVKKVRSYEAQYSTFAAELEVKKLILE